MRSVATSSTTRSRRIRFAIARHIPCPGVGDVPRRRPSGIVAPMAGERPLREVAWVFTKLGTIALGGCCFIFPAMAIVLALAWIYVRYGATPSGAGILYGIAPVVIAIIVHAIVRLGRTAVRTPVALVLAAGVVVGYFLGVNVLILLLGPGVAMLIVRRTRARSRLGSANEPAPAALRR